MSADSLFGSTILDNGTLTSSTFLAGPLNPVTKYFWRVSATNAGGSSTWSVVFHFTTTDAVTVLVPVDIRWNMISVPLTVTDSHAGVLFPSASSSVFGYNGTTYVPQDILSHATGYWAKFPSSQNIAITGQQRLSDSIAVETGWNLIGSLSAPVPVSSILQSPNGIVSSKYFGYDRMYDESQTLEPGKGYWVKVSGNGVLHFQAP
jgi:hypothetical protein